MKRALSILFLTVTLCYLQSGLAAIKCWTNNDGVRECGNVVPPEYAQQETRTLDNRGVTIEIRGRARSREELKEDRRLADEQQLREREAQQKRERQKIWDRVLLSTFLKGEEIIAARDRKLAVLNGYLELTQISINKLKEKLELEQRKVANRERSGKPVPDALMAQIKTIREQIAAKEETMRRKEDEKEQLRRKYDADYERFMELKGGRR